MSFLGLSRSFSTPSGRKHICLSVGACLVTVLAIFILVKLGLWQIDRGQEKQAIIEQHAAAQEAGAQELSQCLISQTTFQQDDRVQATGTFAPDDYLLIDNQTFEGRVGYHVIGLLNVANMTVAVPINLGWVPLPGRRDILPEIELPTGEQRIQGRVNLPAERPFLLREQHFEAHLPQRIQYLELEPLSLALNRELAYFSVLLDEDAPFGFVRDWPVVISEPHRHYAYAVQWFGLAIAALIVFIFASRRTLKSSSRQENNKNDQ